jgi:3-hydroxybutyryl-CoA dehydrogenase
MAREFTKVGVVGLGTMGAGITEVFARSGLEVVAVERDEESLAAGIGHVETSTSRAVKRGKLAEDQKQAIFDRITFTASMADLADCHLVVEAVPENLQLKQEILSELDRITSPDAILATNTSSLSVTEISVATHRPAQVVGMHFFNPAPVLKLVEVIRTVVTDAEVIEDVKALAERLGKVPVVVGDKAGFIANALLFGYLNHAVAMFEQRYATREDIDDAMKLGCGLPMGPLALLDLIGLDTAYEILDTMYRQTRDRLHAPAPIIKQMVTAGLTGRKNGRGFYTYEAPGSPVVVPDAQTPTDGDGGNGVRSVQRVGIVGSGTMAVGIAEVFAKAGFDVVLRARGEEQIARAKATIDRSLEKAVVRGKLAEDERDAARARLTGSTSFDDLADCDLLVEATVEELTVKQAVFATLDEVAKPGAILATTTSSLPVVEIAAATERMGDVAGLHFFNPAQVMKLVEVVGTINTAPEVLTTLRDVCHRIGKHPVTCNDRAGFIVNALLFPYLNDAVAMLEAHYADADDIDNAMKVGCGYPMGPFELLDVVGLDVALAIQTTLYREFRDRGYAPAPLMEHLVTAGYLGRKSGRGFRVYA